MQGSHCRAAGPQCRALSKVHPVRSHSVAAQGESTRPSAQKTPGKPMPMTPPNQGLYLGPGRHRGHVQGSPQDISGTGTHGRHLQSHPRKDALRNDRSEELAPRTCYAADRTGHALLHAMYEQLMKRRCKV